VTAGNKALDSVLLCRKSGSIRFGSVYSTAVIRFPPAKLKVLLLYLIIIIIIIDKL
jgi:hypothetical protein